MDGEEALSEALSESDELPESDEFSESDELSESDRLSESDELLEKEPSEGEYDDDGEEQSEDKACDFFESRRSRFVGGCACTRSAVSRLCWLLGRAIVLTPRCCNAEKY